MAEETIVTEGITEEGIDKKKYLCTTFAEKLNFKINKQKIKKCYSQKERNTERCRKAEIEVLRIEEVQ